MRPSSRSHCPHSTSPEAAGGKSEKNGNFTPSAVLSSCIIIDFAVYSFEFTIRYRSNLFLNCEQYSSTHYNRPIPKVARSLAWTILKLDKESFPHNLSPPPPSPPSLKHAHHSAVVLRMKDMLVNLQNVCRSWLTYKVLICTHIIHVTDAVHLVSTYYNATRAIMLLIQLLGSLHFANCLSYLYCNTFPICTRLSSHF